MPAVTKWGRSRWLQSVLCVVHITENMSPVILLNWDHELLPKKEQDSEFLKGLLFSKQQIQCFDEMVLHNPQTVL